MPQVGLGHGIRSGGVGGGARGGHRLYCAGMEAMTLMVLGILALGALVAAAWAMAARGKIAAELGECRAELAGARAEGAQRLEFVRRQEAAWDAREREVVWT